MDNTKIPSKETRARARASAPPTPLGSAVTCFGILSLFNLALLCVLHVNEWLDYVNLLDPCDHVYFNLLIMPTSTCWIHVIMQLCDAMVESRVCTCDVHVMEESL